MNMELKIEKCPEGLVNGKCKTQDCIYQEGKWKGESIPNLEIEAIDAKPGTYKITCQDMEE